MFWGFLGFFWLAICDFSLWLDIYLQHLYAIYYYYVRQWTSQYVVQYHTHSSYVLTFIILMLCLLSSSLLLLLWLLLFQRNYMYYLMSLVCCWFCFDWLILNIMNNSFRKTNTSHQCITYDDETVLCYISLLCYEGINPSIHSSYSC